MAEEHTPQSLHVPQSTSSASQSVKDIMNAYNSQSKIQLYGDESALSNDTLEGVSGREIPLAALRPRQTVVDDDGNVVAIPASASAGIVDDTRKIASVYRKMKGIPETPGNAPGGRFDGVPRYEAEYVEDMPEDDEGLLGILELAIDNAKANLEMLQSLYAALLPR